MVALNMVSIYLYVFLNLFLSPSLSPSPCLFLFLSLPLSLSFSLSRAFSLYLSASISPSVSLNIFLAIYLKHSVSMTLNLFGPISLSIYRKHPSIILPFIPLSVGLSVRPCIPKESSFFSHGKLHATNDHPTDSRQAGRQTDIT